MGKVLVADKKLLPTENLPVLKELLSIFRPAGANHGID